MRITLRWLLTGIIALCSVRPVAAQESFTGLGFDDTLSSATGLTEVLRTPRADLRDLPINVRLVVERSAIEGQPGVYDFSALDARMNQYRTITGVSVHVDLRDPVAAPEALEAWGRFVRAVAGRYRGYVRSYVIGIQDPGVPRPDARAYALYVKSTVVSIRAGDDRASAIIGGVGGGDTAWLESLYAEDVAAYVDAIGLTAGSTIGAITAVVDRHDSSSGLVLLGESLGQEATAAPRLFLERHLGVLGTRIGAVTYASPAPVVSAALPSIAALRDLLNQQLVSLDETVSALRITRGGEDVTNLVPHRLLFGLGTNTSYFVYTAPAGPIELTLSERTGRRPVVADALRHTREPARVFTYDPAAITARVELPGQPYPLVVDWSQGDGVTLAALEQVSATVLPSIAEIISRHQQAQAAQDALLTSYVANATMEQHFRTTAADPGFDVVTENRFFVEGKSTEWEELSFRLNGTRWGADRPPFPLLQAEKVLSLPFDLRLNTDYRYRLDGVEDVDGRACFAVRFDPIDETRSLYRGTVWLDRTSFMKVKAQTLQTQLSAPVLSSEEIQHFAPAGAADGREIVLLTRLVGRQTMLIAGRNLLVEREVRFEEFTLNPTDFAPRRLAARASDNIMYRDTDEGLRYLVKKNGERVVDNATTRSAKAMLLGVTYDPAYDYPLPLGGINYLDFDFLGKDNQLAVLFGGVLALINVQRPKLLGERVDGSLDLFAIAVPGSDRTYDPDGEVPGERLLTIPFSTGVNVGWRFAEFSRLVANYQFQFNWYGVEDATAATFEPPVSTATNGVGLSWEWKRAGYALTVGGTAYRRVRWEAWGNPGDYDPTHQDYLKYTASLTKDFFVGFQKIHLNAAYYGGDDLDRFSQYQFGLFDDNRVRGVPSAGVRFAELGMARGSYSLNLFDVYRLDLFVDQAFGRDPRVASEWQALTGVGVGFNTRGPRNTLLRGEFGKSFLPANYRQPGSIVFQFQVLKPL
jgi:MucB/RseB N-terminal domain